LGEIFIFNVNKERMNMETFEKPRTRRRSFPKKASPPRFKSVETFLNWHPEDGYRYEWNNGIIERSDRMKEEEIFIIRNIGRIFTRSEAYQRGDELFSEVDVTTFPGQVRRPDFTYLTKLQVERSVNKQTGIPLFIIEVISPNDRSKYLEDKLQEYFDAGVQVVWYVYPSRRQVFVYRSPQDIQPCTRPADICSAAPALPDFEISVDELFRLP